MAEEEALEPKIEEVQMPGSLVTSFDAIKSKIAQIPLYSVSQNGDELVAVNVESVNIHKEPFLFYIIRIRKDGFVITYSIVPNTSERLRRATVVKNVASFLAIIADDFKIDNQKFLQYVDSAITDLLNGLNDSYSVLFNKYDSLLAEYASLRKLVSELTISNRNLTVQTTQLSEENKNLKAQLDALQTYSDETLMTMVQDWLEVHDSTIDIDEFAKTYKLSQPRVEQVLNKMVSLGYIELKG